MKRLQIFCLIVFILNVITNIFSQNLSAVLGWLSTVFLQMRIIQNEY
jgi:hypothetical protein